MFVFFEDEFSNQKLNSIEGISTSREAFDASSRDLPRIQH